MMAISFVAKAETIQNSGNQIVINKPAGVAAGDLMAAELFVEGSSAPSITPPSGWQSKGTSTSGATRGQVFTKIAGDSEPASYTFTASVSLTRGTAAISAYTAIGAIELGQSSFDTNITNPTVAPSVTTSRPDSKLFCGFITSALGSGVSGMTQRVALDNAVRDVAAFDQDIASAGATGTRTYTGSSGGWGYSLSIEEVVIQNRIRMMI